MANLQIVKHPQLGASPPCLPGVTIGPDRHSSPEPCFTTKPSCHVSEIIRNLVKIGILRDFV